MQNPITIQDITTLFVVVDDCLLSKPKGPGRPSHLSESEMITILIWCTLILRQKNIITIHKFLYHYHSNDFPKLPNYQNFVAQCHRMIPVMWELLQSSLAKNFPIQLVDSTMLQVCKIVRVNQHKVAKSVATLGKNHQGWHYGFKLHATVTPDGRLGGIMFTPASFHDAQALPHLIRGKVKILVGDSTYGAGVMRQRIWEEKGCFVLAPPHYTQKKKVMAQWQKRLLRARPKIESVYDYLKNHLGLVTSFPRSIMGYLFHYLRILVAYQFELAFF